MKQTKISDDGLCPSCGKELIGQKEIKLGACSLKHLWEPHIEDLRKNGEPEIANMYVESIIKSETN